MKILNVFAHPDDLLLWAFGSMMIEKTRRNAKVLHFILTKNKTKGKKNFGIYNEHKILTKNIQYRDLNKEILTVNPDKIITHWGFDSNEEHRIVFNLVSSAILSQRINNGKGELYSISTYNGIGLDNMEFAPDLLIDISDYWEVKKETILKLEDEPSYMWLEMARKQNEFYGSRIKVKYAEAFKKINVAGVFDNSDQF